MMSLAWLFLAIVASGGAVWLFLLIFIDWTCGELDARRFLAMIAGTLILAWTASQAMDFLDQSNPRKTSSLTTITT